MRYNRWDLDSVCTWDLDRGVNHDDDLRLRRLPIHDRRPSRVHAPSRRICIAVGSNEYRWGVRIECQHQHKWRSSGLNMPTNVPNEIGLSSVPISAAGAGRLSWYWFRRTWTGLRYLSLSREMPSLQRACARTDRLIQIL